MLKAFNETIELRDERYEVCLPWKDRQSDLHDNRAVAIKRLCCLLHQLSQSKEVLLHYDVAVRQYLTVGHAEPIPAIKGVTTTKYYMPHREVIRTTSTTTKLRIVFNASSHASGVTSFNDHMKKVRT